MKDVWREYGVIALLLIVAVGGYLLYSRNQDDVLRYSMDLVGSHLIALVPEGPDRDRAAEAVRAFSERVAAQEVPAEQVEAFAANVFNLSASGEMIDADDAEMVVRLALESGEVLPESMRFDAEPAEVPLPVVRPPTPDELREVGERIEHMSTFFVDVRESVRIDSVRGAPFRFYANQGLHVIVDEAAREHEILIKAASNLPRPEVMAWKARFAESMQHESERHAREAQRLDRLRAVVADSMLSQRAAMAALASLRRLESRGVIAPAEVESLAVSIEAQIHDLMVDLESKREAASRAETRTEVSSASAASSALNR